MTKINSIPPDKFSQYLEELTDLWQQQKVIQFSQRVVDLRRDYRKSSVKELLSQLEESVVITKETEHAVVHSDHGFKLFDKGDTVEALEDIFSGGNSSRLLAKTGQRASVLHVNRLHSNRYIIVRFQGQAHKVVAPSSFFKKVGGSSQIPGQEFQEDHISQ